MRLALLNRPLSREHGAFSKGPLPANLAKLFSLHCREFARANVRRDQENWSNHLGTALKIGARISRQRLLLGYAQMDKLSGIEHEVE